VKGVDSVDKFVNNLENRSRNGVIKKGEYVEISDSKTFPVYEEARNFWLEVQRGQIQKGLKKYGKPLDPNEWTGSELIEHAVQENVDQLHYLFALREKYVGLVLENRELREENERLKAALK
jgi:hypothetical protein